MIKRSFKIGLRVFLIMNSISVMAQHVSLSNFFLISNSKEVLMYWTVDSGSTCNGITIWHSADSLNYEEIGNIGGVCGSNSSPTPYNFTDKSPQLNKVNYYKLRLGYAQFTEVKTITIKYTEPGKLFVYPNPSIDQTVIEFNNDHLDHYTLVVSNNLGNVVYRREEVIEGKILLSTAGWDSGTYFVTLSDNNGRILKEKLIINK